MKIIKIGGFYMGYYKGMSVSCPDRSKLVHELIALIYACRGVQIDSISIAI